MLGSLWYLLHPLNGKGYQFWSGIGSEFSKLALVGALLAAFRQHQCHVRGCWLIGHKDPEVCAPACRLHHSARSKRGECPDG